MNCSFQTFKNLVIKKPHILTVYAWKHNLLVSDITIGLGQQLFLKFVQKHKQLKNTKKIAKQSHKIYLQKIVYEIKNLIHSSQQNNKNKHFDIIGMYWGQLINWMNIYQLEQILPMLLSQWKLSKYHLGCFLIYLKQQSNNIQSVQIETKIEICLNKFNIPLHNVDFSYALLKQLSINISQILYYYKNQQFAQKWISYLNEGSHSSIQLILSYISQNEKIFIEILFILTTQINKISHEVKFIQKLSIPNKLLITLSLLQQWYLYQKQQNLLNSTELIYSIYQSMKQLLYLLYSNRMQYSYIVLVWFKYTLVQFNQQFYQQVLLPHLLTVAEIYYQIQSLHHTQSFKSKQFIYLIKQLIVSAKSVPKKYVNMKIFEKQRYQINNHTNNYKNNINHNNTDNINGYNKIKHFPKNRNNKSQTYNQTVNHTQTMSNTQTKTMTNPQSNNKSIPTKINIYTILEWNNQLQIQIKNLNFVKIYLQLYELNKLDNSNEYIQSKQSLLMNLSISIIKILDDNIHHYECKLLLIKIKQQLNILLPKLYNKNNLIKTHIKYQYLGMTQKYLNIDIIINNIQYNYHNCKIIYQLYRVKKYYKNYIKKTNMCFQQINQLELIGLSLSIYNIYKEFFKSNNVIPIQQRNQFIIVQILKINVQHTIHQLLLNIMFIIFNSNNDNIIKIYQLFGILIDEYILNDQKKHSKTCWLLLHAYQIFQLWQSNLKNKQHMIESKKIKYSSNNFNAADRYLQFLKKKTISQSKAYIIGAIYQSFNSIKESIYFYEMAYYQKQIQKNKLQNQLLQCYCRVNPHVKQIQHMIKKQYNISSEQKIQVIKENYFEWVETVLLLSQNHDSIHSKQNDQHKLQSFTIFIINKNYAKIAKLSENIEIKRQYLKGVITLKIMYLKTIINNHYKFINIIQNTIVEFIKLLQVSSERISAYKLLNSISKSSLSQQIYLNQLCSCSAYDTLYEELNKRFTNSSSKKIVIKTFDKYSFLQLKLLMKYYYYKKDYLRVLLIAKKIQDQHQNSANQQLYCLQLQSYCNYVINYKLQDVLKFIGQKCMKIAKAVQLGNNNKNISQKSLQDIGMDERTNFYLRMFRYLFQQYTFISIEQNRLFIDVFKFYMISITRKNAQISQSYCIEAMYYLLRFVLEKFIDQNDGYKYYCTLIISSYSLSIIKPHVNYLVRCISLHKGRNNFITYLLTQIAVKFPNQSIWWLSALLNHKYVAKSQSKIRTLFNDVDNQIEAIGIGIFNQIMSKQIDIKAQLHWIKTIVHVMNTQNGLHLRNIKVPQNIQMPFKKGWIISSVQEVSHVGEGKSHPVRIIFLCQQSNTKRKDLFALIKKYNLISVHRNYRIQSNTANFFSSIQILDKQCTYELLNLTKFTLLIEHISHISSLKRLTTQNKYVKKRQNDQIENKIISKKQMVKLGKLYDQCQNLSYGLYRILFEENMSIDQWWAKYSNYIYTHAGWSFLGYVVGLGDRHGQNILLKQNFKIVHIDFQYALDQGLFLRYPEWVPFRLVHSMIETMGLFGQYGYFMAEMIHIAKQYNSHQRQIWKALSYFQNHDNSIVGKMIQNRATFKKYNSIEQGCQKIIQDASDPCLLREMFFGWGAHF